jgi:hypothetical protein
MYTTTPPRPEPALAKGTNYAALRCLWWTIPKTSRFQMYAFTSPNQQLLLKVRDALSRSLHHASPYQSLIIANKENGARTDTGGRNLDKWLISNPKEGTTLLKFI